jgi:hypothetical protein
LISDEILALRFERDQSLPSDASSGELNGRQLRWVLRRSV